MKDFYIVNKNQRIYTDLRNQVAPSGRPFRLVGIVKDVSKPSKWINKMERWHWIFEYRYTDRASLLEGFNLEIDYFDEKIAFYKVNFVDL